MASFVFLSRVVGRCAVLTLAVALSAQSPQQGNPELGPAPRFTGNVPPAPTPSGVVSRAPYAFSGWLDISNRETVRQSYLNVLQATAGTAVGFTGNVDTGDAGDTSQTYKDAVATRINWFRALAGVPPVITLDPANSAKDQKAALMFSANNALDHYPPSSWKYYSADGYEAAHNSNICLGYILTSDPGCVAAYIQDDGSNNAYVGHRRWLLYPQTQVMGTGDVSQSGHPNANAIWVFDSNIWGARPGTRESFVAWPPPGYTPNALIPARWSFSKAGVDFGSATVTMSQNGNNISVVLEPYATGYGENTIVFKPGASIAGSSTDATVTVTISNVSGGPYTYQVIAFDPSVAGGGSLAAPSLNTPANGATNIAATGTSLTWNTATGAASYDVYFGTAANPPLVTNTTGLSYAPGNLTASTTYYWKVVSRNGANTAGSSTWSFTTAGAGPQPPSVPTLSTPANGATGVSTSTSIVWNSTSGATSYDVYFGTAVSPGFAVTTSSLNYSPGTLSPGTTYYWKVVARNTAGTTSSAVWSFTTAVAPPGTPQLSSPSNGATGVALSTALTWIATTGAANYDVYFGTSPSPSLITNTTSLTWSPTLAASTTYYWKIVANNASGSTSSAVWSFTTAAPPTAPAVAVLAAPANGATGIPTSPILSWNASTGATSYDVYFGTQPSPALFGNTTEVSLTPGTLAAGTTYYWKVAAKNSGGSSASAVWSFTTAAATPAAPAAASAVSPANGATGVATGATLNWSAASGATSYDLYFGASAQPGLLLNTTSLTYSPGPMATNRTYYWQVVAKNSGGSTASPVWSFTTTSGSNPAPPAAPQLISPGNTVTGISTAPTLSWSASAGATSYDINFGSIPSPGLAKQGSTDTSYTPGTLAPLTTYYWQVTARNSGGSAASAVYSFTTGSGATQTTGTPFVPIAPCRVIDTRAGQGTSGAFGPPTLVGGARRDFPLPQGRCSIPATVQAYSLNVTVVPKGSLGYLSLWPAGAVQPTVSTLNSFDGSIVANAAVVPAGTSGGISVYVTDATDLVVDINGYFDNSGASNSSAFYALTPCRVADTRGSTGQFGGPSLNPGQSRDFLIGQSTCSVPATARAYSLNATVVPSGPLGYLSLWPSGQAQPTVSTLNSPAGKIVANAALIPAGTNGGVTAFATDRTDLILDINGYYGPSGNAGALTLVPVTPCRVLDTRNAEGPYGGPVMSGGATRTLSVAGSSCGLPSNVKAWSLNITVVPQEPLGYLTVWPTGSAQPYVSTLNSLDGRIVANAAIVPADAAGAINIYVTHRTHVIVDVNGYFAPAQ